ncbi:MAG: tyrosine recombinase XerC [Streptosporangiaceae bacterium]
MTETKTGQPAKRRSRGDDAIYFDESKGRYVGAISLGCGPDGKRLRRKVTGKTKAEVKDKLRAERTDLDAGVRTSATYTLTAAVEDWLAERDGVAASTAKRDQLILKPVLAIIGTVSLRDLTTHDVRKALTELAENHSSATVALVHNCLVRVIRHAESGDHVRRNVAALVTPPKGAEGRASKAMTKDETAALLSAAKGSRLSAYIVLSLTTGIRTEEARALRWDHVDLDAPSVDVYRSVRASGDTKTRQSRRTLGLPQAAVEALRVHQEAQQADRLAAGRLWKENGLVFPTVVGTLQLPGNVLRQFRAITTAAGLGTDWTPRELRHTFVSIMSQGGVPVEEIARLAGHSSSRTTELVYRHELRPVLTAGAEVMDRLLGA